MGKFINGQYGLLINFWISFVCLFIILGVFLNLSVMTIWILLVPSSIAVWNSSIDSCNLAAIELYRFSSRAIIFGYWAIVLFIYFEN